MKPLALGFSSADDPSTADPSDNAMDISSGAEENKRLSL